MRSMTLFLLSLGLAMNACERQTPAESPQTTEPEESQSAADETAAEESVTDVDAEEAAELLKSNPDITVVDVRTPAEFADGHIEGAVNIDFSSPDFGEKLQELDRDGAYLMHCESGGRSGQALSQFKALDFNKVYHFETGMQSWREAGLPTEE
ncbi:MAG: rhodanese-like domain-containing protein [Verrucomicrobiales bacterium]